MGGRDHPESPNEEIFPRTIPICFRSQEEDLMFRQPGSSSTMIFLIFYCILKLIKCVLVDCLFKYFCNAAVRPSRTYK